MEKIAEKPLSDVQTGDYVLYYQRYDFDPVAEQVVKATKLHIYVDTMHQFNRRGDEVSKSYSNAFIVAYSEEL